MSTINQVGVGLSGATGTVNFVGSTSPTIVTPRIGQINDTNGNGSLLLSATTSAVNYIQITNGATGSPTNIQAIGSDTDINMGLYTKGIGAFSLVSSTTTLPLIIYNGTGSQHSTTFSMSNTAAARTVTFPDASGTVGFTSTGSWTPVFTSSGGGTATYTLQTGTYTTNGNTTSFSMRIVLSGLPSAGNVTITGLPGTLSAVGAVSVYGNALQATVTSPLTGTIPAVGTISLNTFTTGASSILTVAQCTSTTDLFISGTYIN